MARRRSARRRPPTHSASGRVEHLLVDPGYDFAGQRLFAERAVEAAVAAGGRVSCVPAAAADRLAEAGGIAALLRY